MTTINKAGFYEHNNYGGAMSTFSLGTTVINSFNNMNNEISSIKVSDEGTYLAIWDTVNTVGSFYILRGPIDVPNLNVIGWNDRIRSSSLGTPPAGGVTLFADANGLGKFAFRSTDSSDLAFQIGNDKLSSIRLFPRTLIQIFRDINYGGPVEEHDNPSYTNSILLNVNNNDWASSIKLIYF